METVRKLKGYGVLLMLLGLLLYILVFGFEDAVLWELYEFFLGSLCIVIGSWCFYRAGMEYDRVMMEREQYRES